MVLTGENWSTRGEKDCPNVDFFYHKIPHVLTWDRTQASWVTNHLTFCTAPTTGVFDKHSHHYSGTVAKCLLVIVSHSHESYTWPTQPTTHRSTVCLTTVNESWKLNIRHSFAFSHMYRQVADECTSALFPRCGKYMIWYIC